MGLSTKALFAGAAGIAALSFVGVGVGATMNDSAAVPATINTGTVGIAVQPGTQNYGMGPVYSLTGDGTNTAWTIDKLHHQPLATPVSGNSIGFSMPSNIGSFFAAQIPVVINNTGSEALNYVTLSMSDAPANETAQLAKDTTMWIAWNGSPGLTGGAMNHSCEATVADFENGTACGEVAIPKAITGQASSKGLELVGPNSYTGVTSLAKGQSLELEILVQSDADQANHTYNNADEGQTINPTFHVDAVDQNL